jgi:hypothetical protein
VEKFPRAVSTKLRKIIFFKEIFFSELVSAKICSMPLVILLTAGVKTAWFLIVLLKSTPKQKPLKMWLIEF